jgi:hypothetical protein
MIAFVPSDTDQSRNGTKTNHGYDDTRPVRIGSHKIAAPGIALTSRNGTFGNGQTPVDPHNVTETTHLGGDEHVMASGI